MGVLEPFIRDPTVQWGRSGKANIAQRHAMPDSKHPGGGGVGGNGGSVQDIDNADAKEAMQRITERLSGIYNIIHPTGDTIRKEYQDRQAASTTAGGTVVQGSNLTAPSAVPTRGLGASKEDLEGRLSVQGQVQRLVEEATAIENLAQMYIGWSAWL